jgi:hypothetical protein
MGRIDVAIRADRTKANALHRGIPEGDDEEQEEDGDEQDEQSDDGEGYSE